MRIAKSFYRPLRPFYAKLVNRRYRSKLFLVFLLVTIVPVSFLVAYAYHAIKDQLVRQAVDNVGGTMAQLDNNIENKLDLYAQISTLIYLDTELRNYLVNPYKKNDVYVLDAFDYINKSLYKIMAMNPNLKAITIYSDNESLNSDGFFIKHMEDLPQTLRDRSFQAEGRLTSFYQNDSADGKVILLARSLNYLSLNYPYGILTMEISDWELYSLIEKENKNKTIYVADENGDVITSSVRQPAYRNVAELLPGGAHADALNAGRPVYAKIGGEPSILVEKRLSNGWRTVVVLPYDELIDQASDASRRMLLISLACIAVAVVLIYGTSQLMTKRFESLLQQIRKVERGHFDVDLRRMGTDEVGQLSFALKKMAVTIQELINDVYKKEIAQKEAEMDSLQAQISPHFLYNTLASISALAVAGDTRQSHRMADDLARFYRISLSKGKKSIPIEQELRLTEHYLAIQKVRFEGLFDVRFVLDESLLHYTTPKLILQPFLENCINHAMWDEEKGIGIVIRLTADGGDLVLAVIDDGMGIPRDVMERMRDKPDQSAGYGIYNVHKRIQLAFGERYGVRVYSRLGIGTSVHIRMPMTR
ncbi:two-component system, sensor histidine kinase YesM [Paenibacillus sp. UNC496MF]|uniref:sensor histidine kinase n=1 Tax=Paenibacillus sp. UNC496MF TaxID=1502753 RepID=UPI0008E40B08|nr:sensor histidine kinase [Paenibacillus sp. UNC496MF]SFJ84122.1 two-component system, sensor histidine kinase YesM [Paenibacillus sp. UNC496MF]